MLPWYLRDSARVRRERTGIDELSRSADWLVGTKWELGGDLHLDAVIRAHGHDYEVRVSFPALYPDAPCVVRPLNMENRLSSHQYGGADGPLCLEWGPDNWHNEVTAVQMLESTYRLLNAENPLGENRPEVPIRAPSRHKLTLGQELRDELVRWYFSEGLRSFFATQPSGAAGAFKFSLSNSEKKWTCLVHEATPIGGEIWRDSEIPNTLPEAEEKDLQVGVWLRTDLASNSLRRIENVPELRAIVLMPWQ
jgi:hypothetical protein